ncbi:hypothetical protein PUN28_016478 [Cardiocondyla obscurior]|uniref:Uncharacterized protein n=1 Tax=Cardiocondyla obscurior TaxID=286306 RepID=A0AAW2ESP7_9HYME
MQNVLTPRFDSFARFAVAGRARVVLSRCGKTNRGQRPEAKKRSHEQKERKRERERLEEQNPRARGRLAELNVRRRLVNVMNMYPPTPGTRYSNAVHSRPLGPNPRARPTGTAALRSGGGRRTAVCWLIFIGYQPYTQPDPG